MTKVTIMYQTFKNCKKRRRIPFKKRKGAKGGTRRRKSVLSK